MGLAASGTLEGGALLDIPEGRLHGVHLVRVWATMHLIVLVLTPERSGFDAILCRDSLYIFILCGGILYNFHFLCGVV